MFLDEKSPIAWNMSVCFQYHLSKTNPYLPFLRCVGTNPMENTMEFSAVTDAPASSNAQSEEVLSTPAFVSCNKCLFRF